MLGLYIALSRVIVGKISGGICGSVAVSSTRTELRDLARKLRFDGTMLGEPSRSHGWFPSRWRSRGASARQR